MKLTIDELHLCYQALRFMVDQVTDDLTENTEDWEDEIKLIKKIANT